MRGEQGHQIDQGQGAYVGVGAEDVATGQFDACDAVFVSSIFFIQLEVQRQLGRL